MASRRRRRRILFTVPMHGKNGERALHEKKILLF